MWRDKLGREKCKYFGKLSATSLMYWKGEKLKGVRIICTINYISKPIDNGNLSGEVAESIQFKILSPFPLFLVLRILRTLYFLCAIFQQISLSFSHTHVCNILAVAG